MCNIILDLGRRDNGDDFSSCISDDEADTTHQCQLSYADLINDLIKVHPDFKNRHFESFANAQYCEECRMVLLPKYVACIPCKVPEFVVQQDGTVVCVHTKCKRLDVLEYLRSAAIKAGSWKNTYWRAWSECHFLSCATCECLYPVRNSAMCRYHPEKPEYSPVGRLGLEQPIGHYPCCGEKAFRFKLIKYPVGCKFRFHVPNIKNECDARIEEMMRKRPKLIIVDPSPSLNCENQTTEFDDSDTGIKILNYQRWWIQMKLEESVCTYQPIILLIDTPNGQKKANNLNKRLKKKMHELPMRTVLEQTDFNHSANSDMRKKHEINSTPSNSEFPFTSKRELSRKLSLPIGLIQDIQREQEIMFFDRIIEQCNSTTKIVKSLPGTSGPPKDRYATAHENILTTMMDENKKDVRQQKPTKRQ